MSEQNPQPQFNIHQVLTEDISFESPKTPAIFKNDWAPQAEIELNTNSEKLTDNMYRSSLLITITAKTKDDVAFLVEVKQSGLFEISGVDQTHLDHLLGSYCPNLLFPYARETISGLVCRAGFPQLTLAPIDFDMLYQQNQAQQNATKH